MNAVANWTSQCSVPYRYPPMYPPFVGPGPYAQPPRPPMVAYPFQTGGSGYAWNSDAYGGHRPANGYSDNGNVSTYNMSVTAAAPSSAVLQAEAPVVSDVIKGADSSQLTSTEADEKMTTDSKYKCTVRCKFIFIVFCLAHNVPACLMEHCLS